MEAHHFEDPDSTAIDMEVQISSNDFNISIEDASSVPQGAGM